jgi:ABC-2 type transport system ATP-binding protein/lipopolysaccharide transport system ATP-binding protein
VSGSSIVVLASHSLDLVRQWCRQAIYLRQGVAQAIGPVEDVIACYEAALL